MLIILPPSETKRDGGDPARRLSLDSLSFAQLTAPRQRAVSALRRLARNRGAAAALRLGPTQARELERNKQVEEGPTMPAIERFDGVLYEALDVSTLPPAAREFAHDHLVIASALFGLVGPDDPIPAYRLSPDSRLPGTPLKALWRGLVSALLAAEQGMILDLRSEAYAALGPAPRRDESWYLRVVSEGDDGRRRALNHFNKKGKGEFVRALLLAGIDQRDAGSLIAWAASSGIRLELGEPGELVLVV
ncbi:MAG TPA: peroxide stress protein YaaA [Pseudolysinimonas sp.]|nr:peroxide stress protein YaaA [Pseudolysinimonas sp.]